MFSPPSPQAGGLWGPTRASDEVWGRAGAAAATRHFSSSALCPNTWAVEEVTLEAGGGVGGWVTPRWKGGFPRLRGGSWSLEGAWEGVRVRGSGESETLSTVIDSYDPREDQPQAHQLLQRSLKPQSQSL